MASQDLATFIRERMAVFDQTQDTSTGSPFDAAVTQPIVARLGPDPFTMDTMTFARLRLQQEYPQLAVDTGDALNDLLIKSFALLMDPVIRENRRIKAGQSFASPETMITDEADALGANLFAKRDIGNVSTGRIRIYYAAPQNQSVTPANVAISSQGLRFFPTQIQSIRMEDMLFNQEGSLYYFDVDLQAEQTGNQYNVAPGDIVSITNIQSAVRVTNKQRFRTGAPEETSTDFVDRTSLELTERSLVTLRGILAQIPKAFGDAQQITSIGLGDPEMQRDVLIGGGLGPVLGAGVSASALDDGEGALATRRVIFDPAEVNFDEILATTGTAPQGYVLTLFDAFLPGALPKMQDLPVRNILGPQTIELEDRVLARTASARPWSLRRKELLLSALPGGIVYPDPSVGAARMPTGTVHVGGCYDVYLKGSATDTGSLVIDAVSDDSPVARGIKAAFLGSALVLHDLVLGSTYAVQDPIWQALTTAAARQLSLELEGGPAAGTYRILFVFPQTLGSPPALTLSPSPLITADTYRWKLLDEIDMDLTEPKETRVVSGDLSTIAGYNVVTSAGGLSFSALGVSPQDIFRILSGDDASDYTVVSLAPFPNTLTLDRPLGHSAANVSYAIFRKNKAGGALRPLLRITSIDLLDTSGQPVGSTIPYGPPVEAVSNSFANVAEGIKVDETDVTLGIVGIPLPMALTTLNGKALRIKWNILTPDLDGPTGSVFSVAFLGASLLAPAIVAQINTQAALEGLGTVAVVVDGNRVGILPNTGTTCVIPAGNSLTGLFTNDASVLQAIFGSPTYAASTRDVRSAEVNLLPGRWLDPSIAPPIDGGTDVVQVLDGYQIGVFSPLTLVSRELPNDVLALLPRPGNDFIPQVKRHVQVGSRSVGTARVYFLEPTTCEFGPQSLFTGLLSDGSSVSYLPDPLVSSVRIPAPPSGQVPNDGSLAGTVLTSLTSDFVLRGLQAGDQLQLTYQPTIGSLVLPVEVLLLNLTTLIVSVGGGQDRIITFVRDSNSIGPNSVTRNGVAAQINAALGFLAANINALTNKLEIESDVSIIVRKTGSANGILGFSTGTDTSNDSPNKGTYPITLVAQTALTVSGVAFTVAARQHFQVLRPATQRIGSTQMASNNGGNGLYYFDVKLVSQGTGSRFNISAGVDLSMAGFVADGFFLTTDDPNLCFSTAEKIRLHLSRTFIEVGASDDPSNARQVSGQSIQINYDYSSLVSNVQSFLLAETERVINANPLARHLLPHYLRIDIGYAGGSLESLVRTDLDTYFASLGPADAVEAGSIQGILIRRGATHIDNPITILGVIYNEDRTVQIQRTQNRLTIGRLAAFLPDDVNVTRSITG